MKVKLIYGNERERIFENVKSIIHHGDKMIELKFFEGHDYPANEVYIGLHASVRTFQVSIEEANDG